MHTPEVNEVRLDLPAEKQKADEWLDEALAESFPASDPLPTFHGEAKTLRENVKT